ncbi:hypothetical protein HTSR_0207 [Halodesulfurarchaeum formicicum]|uniref:Uncharacterized protein n=1 Tax=Halodesulfurarchaeum formicicum TaxID=1873524 RepID=A0A1D8S227_9EURY|nr:rod-determining factor RdfA [Halodesulfurarchaeum formicicum]AOW79409.1 hypothetical protein HTSR_0207 [Halodesulfurarchaeum formicicum]
MARLKIQRLVEKYDLDHLDEEFVRRYTVEDQSLRDLADYLNVEITRRYFEGEPFAGEYVYRVLSESESVSKRAETDLRKRLRAAEIDMEELQRDWVTHVPVKSYLNRILDIDTTSEPPDRDPEAVLADVRGAVSHQESIVESLLERIDELDLDAWDLHTELRLIRTDTGESVRLADRLQDLAESKAPGSNSESDEN